MWTSSFEKHMHLSIVEIMGTILTAITQSGDNIASVQILCAASRLTPRKKESDG